MTKHGRGVGARARGMFWVAMLALATMAGQAAAAPWLDAAPGKSVAEGAPDTPVRIDRQALREALEDGVLPVALPGVPRYDIRVLSATTDADGTLTVLGRVGEGALARSAVLTVTEAAVFAALPTPQGGLVRLATRQGEVHWVASGGMAPQTTPGSGPPMPDFLLPPMPKEDGKRAAAGTVDQLTRASETPGGVQINVLGVYTTDLRTLRGGVPEVEAEFAHQFAVTNQSYADSGLAVRFELVGLREVPFAQDMTNNDVLYAATANQLPDGFDLHAMRDQLAADLVAVLRPYRNGHGSCGVAWLNGGGLRPRFPNPAYGYSVNNVDPCSVYVLAHELGHNLGSHHDAETAGGSLGAYPYSYGFRQDGPPAFATIMAYPAQGQERIGQFSRPGDTACLGVACGTAADADNVNSLDQMASRVARFRDAPGTISVLDAAQIEGSAYGLQNIIRLSSPAPPGGVSFDVFTADGTATAGTDYWPVEPWRLTIPEGSRETTISPNLRDDLLVEGDEYFYLRIANVQGATIFDGEGIALIIDDDPRHEVSGRIRFPAGMPVPTTPLLLRVEAFTGQQLESDLVSVDPPLFMYSLPVATGTDLALSVHTPPEDTVSERVVLRGIDRATQVDVHLRPRLRIEGRIVFPEGVAAPPTPVLVGAYGLSPSEYGRSTPAFPPDFRFAFTAEPGQDVRLEVTELPAPFKGGLVAEFESVQEDITYDFIAQAGYTVRGRVRFPVGVTPPNHDIQIGLSRAETDVTQRVDASPPDFAFALTAPEPGTDFVLSAYGQPMHAFRTQVPIARIESDVVQDILLQPMPELRLSEVRVPEGNVQSYAEVTLRLSRAPTQPIQVQVATENGTAVAGRDYQAVSRTLFFQPGQTQQTVQILILGNTEPQPDRLFTLRATLSLDAYVLQPSALVAILDDDQASPVPAFAIGDVNVREGDEGETLARFPLFLSRPAPAGGVRLDLATADGTAKAGSDYVAWPAPGWVIPEGTQTTDFPVRVLGDRRYEGGDETFFARATNVVGASVVRAEGKATIGYDDTAVAPLARQDHYATRRGTRLQVAASSGVLANDQHPFKEEVRSALLLNDKPRHGQLTLANDGAIDYQPAAGFEGEDRFAYNACHQYKCRPAQVFLTVAAEYSAADRYLWMFPPASNQAQQGFVRLVNREARSGQVEVWGIDATGRRSAGTISLTLAPHESRQFNSQDAEWGNAAKGLTGSLGSGEGNWTLVVRSDLDLEPLAYIRTPDGFLTAMHDRVAGDGVDWVVPVFNPAENVNQVSWLRLVNTSLAPVAVEIRGVDDAGRPGSGSVVLTLPARATRELSAADLEAGNAGKGLAGALGDGEGKWRLHIAATGRITAQSLLADPRGYLTNLSTLAGTDAGPVLWRVTPASNPQQQGFVRITNLENRSGNVTLRGVDDAGQASTGAVSFTLAPFASQQLNSQDLEAGNPGKGASGALGEGQGQWRLQVESSLSLEMMGLVRTPDGFLTTLHEQVPEETLQWRVPMFNPAANVNQVSVLRVVNPNDQAVVVAISAVDDAGRPAPGGNATLTVPARSAVELDAVELESGAPGKGLAGALGAGTGKWRLSLDAALPLTVMSLLRDPEGYLTNLSSGTQEETTRLDP